MPAALPVRQTTLLATLGSVTVMPLLILPVMIGALIDGTAMSESEAGWAAAVGAAGAAVASIAVSLRVHHLSLRHLAAFSLVLMALADASSALAVTLPTELFMIVRFLAGLGGGAAYAAVMANFARWDEPDRAYGVFMMMQFALSALGLYGLPLLLPSIGVSGLYLLFAGVGLAALTLVFELPTRGAPDEPAAIKEIEWRIIMSRSALLVLAAIGLYEAANTSHFAYAERFGLWFAMTPTQIGAVLGIATVVGIPGAFAVVWLGDRFGHLLPITIAIAAQVLALLLLLGPKSLGTYTLSMCVLSITWAFAMPYFQAIEAQIDPAGSVVAAGGFFTSTGGALGPAMAAAVLGEGQYQNIVFSAIAVYALCLVLITAAVKGCRV
jgi:predicted MFS family arabinose efflux permease